MSCFISSRANVDDLKSIENKSDFVVTENMPNYVKGAFISMEDERFYKHHGFDIKGTTRALLSTLAIEMCKVEVHATSCKELLLR